MKIEDIKDKLSVFKKFNFEEEPHIYWWVDSNGIRRQAQNSMTQLIGKYSNPFDAERVAPFSAKKLGMTTQAVLDMWKFENDVSKTKGTYIHKYIEHKWLGLPTYDYPQKDVIKKFGYDVLKEMWPKLTRIADNFYEDYKDKIVPIGVELVVGDEYYNICGSIDFLAYNKIEDCIIMMDWKSNKKINTDNQYNQYMLGKLNHLDDINFIHYSLQLNGYQHIIEKNTGLKLKDSHFLVWINEKNDNYIVYKTKELKDEAIKMMREEILDAYGY